MSEFGCPVCGASIVVSRVFDGDYLYRVNTVTGDLEPEKEESNGYKTVGCSKDETHKIPFDLEASILDGIPV